MSDYYTDLMRKVDMAVSSYSQSRDKTVGETIESEQVHSSIDEAIMKLQEFLDINKATLRLNVQEMSTASQHIDMFLQNISESTSQLIEINFNILSEKEMLSRLQQLYDMAKGLVEELGRIPLLTKLVLTEEQSVIIVGANGSGKSSLADNLKQSMAQNVIVVPAQKYLYIKDNPYFQQMDIALAVSLQSNQRLRNNRSIDETFTRIIAALVNDHYDSLTYNDELRNAERRGDFKKSKFDSLKNIWKVLFPDINISPHSLNRSIQVNKGGNTYSLDEMSDGEKSVIHYIAQVLFAPENSIIVIDEPENHLNLSIVIKLWDYLVQERPTCKFVFISHTVEFIKSRSDSHLLWCRGFIYPATWDLVPIESNALPRDLLVELLGSKKPILFCEGDKASLDYKIYGSLFFEEYTVIPVGGCAQVREYLRVFKNANLFIGESAAAVAIIDSDLLEADEISTLKEKDVFVLPFNEIEMFLMCDEILEKTLANVFPCNDVADKIKAFKDAFWDCITAELNRIALIITKTRLDEIFSRFRVQSFKTVDTIENELQKVAEVNVKELHQKELDKLQRVLNARDYFNMLKMCPLKNQIGIGIANVHLDSNYIQKAIYRVSVDKTLQSKLKSRYFPYLQN